MIETNTTTETPAVEQGKTVNVTAFFRLNEAGRRAALLAGNSAAKIQSITGPLPAEHLSLCRIMDDGSVLLPSFTLRSDDAKRLGALSETLYPVNTPGRSFDLAFSVPPSNPLDVATAMADFRDVEIARLAAQKEEEKAREGERNAEYAAWLVRIESGLEADPDAIPSLSPTPSGVTWNWVDENKHSVAVEIRRRKALKAAAEKQAEAAAAAAKLAFVRSWLVAHGTPDQVERFDARLLDEEEYIDAMKDAAFAAFAEFPLYAKITKREVRAVVDDEDGELAGCSVKFRSVDPDALTAAEWAKLKKLRAALPAASIEPKRHEGTLDSNEVAWGVVNRMAALATIQFGPFEFRREYAL